MSTVSIRPAQATDAEAIAEIYNHYVATSTATFDTELKSPQDRAAWLRDHGPEHPVVIAEQDGRIVAWGSLSPWGTRRAYRHTVEISVYVAPGATGTGVGPAVSRELLALGREQGHHAVVSQIVHENAASLKMAARLGFSEAGTLREVGRKFDRWLDVVLMEYVYDEPIDASSTAEPAR